MELTLERVINHPDLRSRHINSASLRGRSFGAVSRREMVSMEVRVDRLDQPDWKYHYNGYSVKIGGYHDHRVLTLTTSCPMTLMKWLKQVLKTVNTKYGVLTVGMSVDVWEKEKMVQICTGSHCFIFILPPKEELARQGGYGVRMAPAIQMLRKFFASPKVFAVAPANADGGTKMESLLKVLNEEYEIVFSNPVEVVGGAATLAQKAKEIGIREYWPTIAAAASNGPWYEEWGVPLPVNFGDGDMLTDQKVMYSAFKTYLCFLIANDNLDHQFKPHPSPASTSAPNNKKNKKIKKKN